jgi:hypothetical protein
VAAAWPYKFLYPNFSERETFDIATYFSFQADFQKNIPRYKNTLELAINKWRENFASGSKLVHFHQDGLHWIDDSRNNIQNPPYHLSSTGMLLLTLADSSCPRSELVEKACQHNDTSEQQVKEALQLLCNRKWLIEDGEEILSIVTNLAS